MAPPELGGFRVDFLSWPFCAISGALHLQFLVVGKHSSGGPHSSPITGQYSCCTFSSPLSAAPSQARPPSVSADTFNLRLGEHFSQMQRPLPCARTSARPFPYVSRMVIQSCRAFPKCQGTLAGSQSCFLDAPCGDRCRGIPTSL